MPDRFNGNQGLCASPINMRHSMAEMLMYQKILVAYDGSSFSDAALRQGAGLASLCKAELHLLAIAATNGGMGLAQAAGPVDVWGIEEQNLRRALDTAAQDLGKRGINVIYSVRLGEPAIEIIAYVHEIKAELVVIGHGDKGIFARWLEGSIGAELLRKLPCSVLIATGKA